MMLGLTGQFVASPLNSPCHFDLGSCIPLRIEGLMNENEVLLSFVPSSATIFPCDPEQTTVDIIKMLE